MKLRRLRGFCVMNLMFFALSLFVVSCSSQQQDEQGLESTQQEGQQDDADQMQGEYGEEGSQGEEASQGEESQNGYDLGNNSNYQAMEGGNNLLGGDELAGGNLNMEGSDNSLANIMSDMNAPDASLGDDAGNAMMDTTQPEGGMAAGAPAAVSGGGVISGSAGPPAGPGLPELGSKMSYVVVKGDTLAKISKKIYGKISKWKELAEISGIDNPGKIYPGDLVYYQLSESSLAFAGEYENITRGEVVVQAGQTLEQIAKEVYGSIVNWKSIWRQNQHIGNPKQLEHGTKIYYVNPQDQALSQIDAEDTENAQEGRKSFIGVHNDMDVFVSNIDLETEQKSVLDSWKSKLSEWEA